MKVYRDFGFADVVVKLALRPTPRIGTDEQWDKAEEALRAALRACGAQWKELPGEGAFYGPKIEYHLQGLDRAQLAGRHDAGGLPACRAGSAPSTWPRTTAARFR